VKQGFWIKKYILILDYDTKTDVKPTKEEQVSRNKKISQGTNRTEQTGHNSQGGEEKEFKIFLFKK
jgi:hypothetical protein